MICQTSLALQHSSVMPLCPVFQDNVKIDAPTLQKLAYRDAGNYECVVTAAAVKGLKKTSSFQLIVEGVVRLWSLSRLWIGARAVILMF